MSDISAVPVVNIGTNSSQIYQAKQGYAITPSQDMVLSRIMARLGKIDAGEPEANIEKLFLTVFQETSGPEGALDALLEIFKSLKELIILSLVIENTLADLKASGYY